MPVHCQFSWKRAFRVLPGNLTILNWHQMKSGAPTISIGANATNGLRGCRSVIIDRRVSAPPIKIMTQSTRKRTVWFWIAGISHHKARLRPNPVEFVHLVPQTAV
jgi:hypothetical protein